MEWYIVVCLILITLNILLSLYCYLQRLNWQRRESYNKGTELYVINKNDKTKKKGGGSCKKAIIYVDSKLRDFIFLYFKIVGYFPSHLIRNFFYKYIFHMHIGKKTVIYYGLEARDPWKISIGNHCVIGDHAIFDARKGIILGNNINLSTGVWLWTMQHDVNSKDFGLKNEIGLITIKDRAWISNRATILPSCNIEEGIVVAAGSVVTKSITEPYSIYAGIPAKIKGDRNKEIDYILDSKHRWFL